MEKQILNGNWNLKIKGKDSGLIPEKGIPVQIPGSVYSALLAGSYIPDPYYRDNELQILPLMDNDFTFSDTFMAEKKAGEYDSVLLRFEGIDTLADIFLNDIFLGSTCNMHRTYEFDIAESLREGENTLRVELHSPTRYIKEENEKVYTGGSWDAMEGFPHLSTVCLDGTGVQGSLMPVFSERFPCCISRKAVLILCISRRNTKRAE